MAVTRRDGGVVTLPSCLQVARHQLAFPFPSRLRPRRCFLNDRILSFSMEIILSRVCQYREFIKSWHESLPPDPLYTILQNDFNSGWLYIYIYIVLFNDSRSSSSRVSCARRMRVSFASYLDVHTIRVKRLEIFTIVRLSEIYGGEAHELEI